MKSDLPKMKFCLSHFTSFLLLAFLISSLFITPKAVAACASTWRTWDAGANTNRWSTNNNWNPNNQPNTTSESALIVSASRPTQYRDNLSISCVDVQSGQLRSRNGRTLTLVGDYFRNLTTNGFSQNTNHTNFWIAMGGTSPQTYENVDPLMNLEISNNSEVTITEDSTILRSLLFTGTSTTLYLDGNLTFASTALDLTIPAGVTMVVNSGHTLTLTSNLTINGALELKSGSQLILDNGTTLTVGSTGTLTLSGASGNIAQVTANGSGNSFSMDIQGIINANYFRLDRLSASGLQVSGTVQNLDNGEFHYLANGGHAITLAASAVLPSSFESIGFFDDDGYGNTKNVDATLYNSSGVAINNWSGGVGGAANETDPNSRISWGAQAGTALTLSDNTPGGSPPATIDQSSSDTLFNTFAFALNQSSASTDITSVTLTMSGSASTTDFNGVKVYRDAGGGTNCVYDSGTDLQIGSTLSLTGSPASATIAIPSGQVSTDSDTNIACIHVLAATSSSAQDANTIQFEISNSVDVTNSQGYSFSGASGPPVAGGISTINGANYNVWQGDNSTNWSTNGNWRYSGKPTASKDCIIGVGTRITNINQALAECLNATLSTGGELSFDSTTREFRIYGSLNVDSGYTFSNTGGGGFISMGGSTNQTFAFGTNFPAAFRVANTGSSPNNVVSPSSSSQIDGLITVASGVLRIPDGVTLTALGGVLVQSGATLKIEGGGTLVLGNGTSLTVNSGGSAELVGSPSQTSTVTSVNTSSSYTVTVNGTISARYYNFDRLGSGGVSIEAGATIDGSSFLQDGSFTYPVQSSGTFLNLKRQIPGNTLTGMSFESSGSPASSITNIDTTGAAAGTLSISSYSGDLSGASFDTDPTYLVSWSGATNTIDISSQATGPSTVDSGNTYNMGRIALTQSQAGASFADTDITNLVLHLNGDGSAGDIDAVRVYADTNCDSINGTQIASGSFSGSPASVSFSITPGAFVVAASATTPPTTCFYVEFDLAPGASDGKTLGFKLDSSSSITDSLGYGPSGSTSFPLAAGSTSTIVGATNTVWTGTVNTNWFTAGNWSAGVPSSTVNCTINSVTNNPVIGSGAASCKVLNIGNGNLTMTSGAGGTLTVASSFLNTGTFTQNDGTLTLNDGGTGADQSVSSNSNLTSLRIEKTGGGTVTQTGTSLTIGTLTYVSGNTASYVVPNGKTLTLTNGVTIPNGELTVQGGGHLQLGASQSISVTGGKFTVSGLNDSYPQNLSQKGKVSVNGAGTWGFSATSGTVDITGFQFDSMNPAGIQINGTSTLANFRSGHFTNLSTSYTSIKAIQFNNANVPTTISDVEWHWGPNNTPPGTAVNYNLASSTGCGGNTISFDQWWGDFFNVATEDPDPNTKVSETACDIVISWANSPVSLIQFIAESFDSEILLRWSTGAEWNHQGFNVYRSTNPASGYVQINSALIRNTYQSLGPIGSYYFVDHSAVNGVNYFYKIEDVAFDAKKTLHGPVSAIPLAGLGSAPAPGSNTNTDENPIATNPDPEAPEAIEYPNAKKISDGVYILAESSDHLRIQINPAAATYTASAWNGSYVKADVKGYSLNLEANQPELPYRSLLIPVHDQIDGASVVESQFSGVATQNQLIQPAPQVSLDAQNNTVLSYSATGSAYSDSNYWPTEHFAVNPAIQSLSGKKYLEIQVWPLRFKGQTNEVVDFDSLTLDISLSSSTGSPPAEADTQIHYPASLAGSAKIRYQEKGLYKVTYADLEQAGLEDEFSGLSTNALRMYWLDQEIPIQVISADSIFNSGDEIRFFGSTLRKPDSLAEEVILSRYQFEGAADSPLRIENLSADPTALSYGPYQETEAVLELEKDLMAINDRSVGADGERIFWARFSTWNGGGPAWHPDQLQIDFDLPGHLIDSDRKIRFEFFLRGRAQYTKNATHHLGIWANQVSTMASSVVFDNYYPTRVFLDLPANYFVPGSNQITLKSLADQVPSGDLAMIDLDRVRITYPRELIAVSDQAEIFKLPLGERIRVEGFTSSNILAYDFSDQEQSKKFSTTQISGPDSDGLYSLDFAIPGANQDLGFQVVLLTENEIKSPLAILPTPGFLLPLKSEQREADLILIGDRDALDQAQPLVQLRESQGLRVSSIDIEQIYAEFSSGFTSRAAVKDFLNFASTNWKSPAPKYVILLGEGSDDPSDRLNQRAGKKALPTGIVEGQFGDFASDDWFVNFDTGASPEMAIGRLPATHLIELETMIQKILSYESGERSPAGEKARSLSTFAADSTWFEAFDQKAIGLNETATNGSSQWMKATSHLLSQTSNPEDLKTEMISQWTSQTPLITQFVGHGSDETWSSLLNAAPWEIHLLNKTQVQSLNHQKLPIVIAMNCRSGSHSQPDFNERSLAEEFMLNPDGGAIAYWGSSTYTLPESQVNLGKSLLAELSSAIGPNSTLSSSEVRLGDLILKAKKSQEHLHSSKDAILSWSLIGDPSLKLPAASFSPKEETTTTQRVPAAVEGTDGGIGGGCGTIQGPPTPPSGPNLLLFWIILLAPLLLALGPRKRFFKRI